MFTYLRENYDEKNIDENRVKELIEKHREVSTEMKKKKDYYLGQHEITERKLLEKVEGPDNKVIINHAKDITDTATGYFLGSPIKYTTTADTDIEKLIDAFSKAGTDENDYDNALDMSIYGVAYEYIYAKEDSTELDLKSLEPENTFIVYDDSIEQKPLFAVYYYTRYDDESKETYYHADIFTKNYIYEFLISRDKVTKSSPKPHFMGDIPVIEYQNNKYRIGDFEQQISLVDAYNKVMSTRVNDKEQFVDAILALYGVRLGEDIERTKEAITLLKEDKLLELPADARAEYIVRTLDETGAETLKQSIKQDIYSISHVPNLTDENFSGNSSGVALEMKLIGLEMLTKTKERYFRKALKKRLEIFCTRLGFKDILNDIEFITPKFSRGLPKNLLELSQIVANLKGIVSSEQLLSLLPFVEDPKSEIEKVLEENQQRIQEYQFMMSNSELEDEEDKE